MNIAQRKAEMLVALRETLMPQLASTPFLQAFIDDFAACDITLPNPQAPRQNVVPTAIARYLPEMMETLSVQPLAQMFRSYVPHILWYEIFQGDATPAAFKQGLVAAQLVGGNGLFRTETLYLGLFFLAPHITYPLHQHAATELYYVLSGSVSLRHVRHAKARHLCKDDFPITAPHQVHELKTKTQPCLIAYIGTDGLTPQNWWWQRLEDGSWDRICWGRTPDGDWSLQQREALTDAEIARAGDE